VDLDRISDSPREESMVEHLPEILVKLEVEILMKETMMIYTIRINHLINGIILPNSKAFLSYLHIKKFLSYEKLQ